MIVYHSHFFLCSKHNAIADQTKVAMPKTEKHQKACVSMKTKSPVKRLINSFVLVSQRKTLIQRKLCMLTLFT